MTTRTVQPPTNAFRAEVTLPGDKSLSHRALIFAALAEGPSQIDHLGPGADVAATRHAVTRLGVSIDGPRFDSPGVSGWRPVDSPIDCGNSGTTIRLLAGALSPAGFRTSLTGDGSLRRRPMERLIDPLEALGANVVLSDGGTAPLQVGGSGNRLQGADVVIPMASAQVRSAFQLAAIQAVGGSSVKSPPGFRDHTERWLIAWGLGEWHDSGAFFIRPGAVPPGRYVLPGDTSSAAFLWASAAIHPGSRVETPEVSLNPGRIGFLQILESMGAEVGAVVTRDLGGDPVGTVWVEGRGLVATDITGPLAVAALDELPLVAVLGAYAEGITTVRDAAELRAKESDRIESSVAMIRALGGGAEATDDGFAVVGTGWLEEGAVAAQGDHRIAMAAAVAATGATGPVTITGADAAAVSWPGFFETLEQTWSSQ
ncbi:MAG: 3-phosphoshikimate 1-carboxyvinyltransferase [Acidimicrobiia bacterium]|nr:3-phosphoshikimate 1-carboxyvinyltransferase [Acidimicrobiia bacterium]